MFLVAADDNGDERRMEDNMVDHSEDSTGSDLLLNSDGSPDRIGALNLVSFPAARGRPTVETASDRAKCGPRP